MYVGIGYIKITEGNKTLSLYFFVNVSNLISNAYTYCFFNTFFMTKVFKVFLTYVILH